VGAADFARQFESLIGGSVGNSSTPSAGANAAADGDPEFISRFTTVGNVPQAELIGFLGFAAVKLCDDLARRSGRSDQLSSRSETTQGDHDDGDGKAQGGSGIKVHDSPRNCLD
jgi:hypothetical protein